MLYEIKKTAEFNNWLSKIKDREAKTAILARISRISSGLFGDCKFLRDSVRELRVDIGKGYRVYFTICGREIIFLLKGGNKRTQSKDIERAIKIAEALRKEGS